MELCLSSQSVDRKFLDGSMDLFKFIDYAHELKLSFVELEDKHFAATGDAYYRRVKAHLDQYGIRCANIAFDCSFGYPTTAQNEEEVKRAEQWMEAAIALDCPNFRLFAGWMGGLDQGVGTKGAPVEKTLKAWDEMVACVQKGCAIAKQKGLKIVIENHNHGGFLSSSLDVIKLFSVLDGDVASLLLDTGNYTDGLAGIARTADKATRHIHLKLNTIGDDGMDGVYDLPATLQLIKGAKFSGTLSLEYEGTQEEFDVLPKVLDYLKKAIV
jgi:sugar phosphate isomerase/epimerase